MRVKEWYGWHFPELAKIVSDNEIYTRLVLLIGVKQNAKQESLEQIEELITNADIA